MDNSQNTDYKTQGYSEQFEKPLGSKKLPYVTPFDVNSFIQSIPANKIVSGIIKSNDGKLQINLDKGTITYSDGITTTVII